MGMSHLGTLGGVITKSHMGRRHEVVDYIDRKWKIKRNFVNNCFLSQPQHYLRSFFDRMDLQR